MAIAILPYDMKRVKHLANVALADLCWPLDKAPSEGVVGDLTEEDHLVVAPSSRRLYYLRKVCAVIFPYALPNLMRYIVDTI